jgi:hypothetical protein
LRCSWHKSTDGIAALPLRIGSVNVLSVSGIGDCPHPMTFKRYGGRKVIIVPDGGADGLIAAGLRLNDERPQPPARPKVPQTIRSNWIGKTAPAGRSRSRADAACRPGQGKRPLRSLHAPARRWQAEAIGARCHAERRRADRKLDTHPV